MWALRKALATPYADTAQAEHITTASGPAWPSRGADSHQEEDPMTGTRTCAAGRRCTRRQGRRLMRRYDAAVIAVAAVALAAGSGAAQAATGPVSHPRIVAAIST